MPKIPEGEWSKYTDPESEEYSPTTDDLEKEEKEKAVIYDELAYIQGEIGRKERDYFTDEESKFEATDPDYFWEQLGDLHRSLSKIGDPTLKKEIEAEISRTEKEVYKHYIPFIDSKINIYGWQNSPAEYHYSDKVFITEEELLAYFDQAMAVVPRLKIDEDEALDFQVELDRLQEKFGRYKKEPFLFTFEDKEEELQSELYRSQINEYPYIEPKQIDRAFDDEGTHQKNLEYIQELQQRATALMQIVEHMSDPETKSKCEERAKSLQARVDYLKMRLEAPRELLALEVQLNEMIRRISNKEEVDTSLIDEIKNKLSAFEKRQTGEFNDLLLRLSKLLNKAERLYRGEVVDEDEDRFNTEYAGINWAWGILGVKRDATKAEVNQAYRRLSLKYHPDKNKDDSAHERMIKINEAYEFLRRYFKHNTSEAM